ncbi:MAG: serine hydrolase [Bacteroidetes bacterium]|jgi:CubicO group peptidase (beta-lactamase class C family)|nr:serine hydrolase [Bacteroidota bacterium]
MRKKNLLLLTVCFSFLSTSKGQTIKLDELDSIAKELMVDFNLPGLAVGIVRNDSILFAKGYGVREINKALPVDTNTIFGIGSISKSFTALTLGFLVNQGKINWDDRVKDYLPYFELYAPYVTENFTIRDLLTHRSGLNWTSGGTLWYHSDLSRTDVIKGLKYLKPISGFRDKPMCQNVMYLVADEIVKEVSGMTWDEFLKVNIFNKIKMKNSTSVSSEREANTNLARPHIWSDNFEKIAVEQEKGDNMAPAAFVYSSVNDMMNYMKLLLSDGVFERDTIVSKGIIDEIFKPQIIFPMFPPPVHNEFTSYGFGWWITPGNGHKIIDHSGGIDGMAANLVMIKDLNIGIIVLTNTDELAPFVLTFKLLEQVLNDKSYDLYASLKRYRESLLAQEKSNKEKFEKPQISGAKPSLDLKLYAGIYNDKMYGDIIVNYNGGNLEVDFSHTPLFKAKLKHWHYDTFIVDWYDPRVPDGFITFNFNAKREITGITLEQQNLLDVDFSELEIKKKN